MISKSASTTVTDEDLLRLDNQLCFALYAATRAIMQAYRERLDPMGLTYPQYLVLLVLWEQDGQTVSQIGNHLLLDSGTLSPLLKRLEAADLVERKRDPHDERMVRIFITDKAAQMRAAAVDARKFVACRLDMSETEIMKLRSDVIGLVTTLGTGSDSSRAAE